MAAASRALLFLALPCIPSAVGVHHASDSCECLGWQAAFRRGANCTVLGDTVCAGFLMGLPDEKFCLNEKPFQAHPGQWCYVSPSCHAMVDGPDWGSSDGVKTRWCGAGEAKLADKLPLELKAWTAKNDLDVALGALFAYPALLPPEYLTADVLSFFGVQPPIESPLFTTAPFATSSTRETLQKVADEGTPTLINSRLGHPPFGIMRGKELYWVMYNEEWLEVKMKHKGDVSHKGSMNDLKCVAGCKEVAPAWMPPLETVQAVFR